MKLKHSGKLLAIMVILLAIASAGVLGFYATQLQNGNHTGQGNAGYPPYGNLPAGCDKPAGGYLVIANQNGFNDSIQHGAPASHWPIIAVKQGTTVDITVCNSDKQPHGFQVNHYFDSNIEAVAPGQVVHIKFLADKAGDFEIYCSILCTIHVFMQNGILEVTT